MIKTFFQILLLAGLLAFISSCSKTAKFTHPQPQGKNDLKQIPNLLRGNYYSTEDTNYLTINENHIVKWAEGTMATAQDSMPIDLFSLEPYYITEDSLELVIEDYNIQAKLLTNDSIRIHYTMRDTLFTFSKEMILRKFKGNYFLNQQVKDSLWNVTLMHLSKDKLTFSTIKSEPKNFQNERTEEEVLSPSRKELKQLMTSRFTEEIKYHRIDD